jgi:hypothetical protein
MDQAIVTAVNLAHRYLTARRYVLFTSSIHLEAVALLYGIDYLTQLLTLWTKLAPLQEYSKI